MASGSEDNDVLDPKLAESSAGVGAESRKYASSPPPSPYRTSPIDQVSSQVNLFEDASSDPPLSTGRGTFPLIVIDGGRNHRPLMTVDDSLAPEVTRSPSGAHLHAGVWPNI